MSIWIFSYDFLNFKYLYLEVPIVKKMFQVRYTCSFMSKFAKYTWLQVANFTARVGITYHEAYPHTNVSFLPHGTWVPQDPHKVCPCCHAGQIFALCSCLFEFEDKYNGIHLANVGPSSGFRIFFSQIVIWHKLLTELHVL